MPKHDEAPHQPKSDEPHVEVKTPAGHPYEPVPQEASHQGTHRQATVDDPPGKYGHQGSWDPEHRPPVPDWKPGENPPGTNPPEVSTRDPGTNPTPGSVPRGLEGDPQETDADRARRDSNHDRDRDRDRQHHR